MASKPQAALERLPPYSIEVEQCYLASLMLAAADFEEMTSEVVRDAFYLADHQVIFEVILMLAKKGAVDAVLLREELSERGLLDEIGGTAYLAEILNTVPSAANWKGYAERMMNLYRWRQMIAEANTILKTAWDHANVDAFSIATHPVEFANRIAASFQSIASRGTSSGIVHIGEVTKAAIAAKQSGVPVRLLVGWNEGDPTYNKESFDMITGGFPIGGNTLVGARPGMGKSAFEKALVKRFGLAGKKCLIVSIEERLDKIGDNMLASFSGVQNRRIQFNRLNEEDIAALIRADAVCGDLPIWVDDTVSRIDEIERTIYRAVKKYGTEVAIVDHLHLIEPDRDFKGNRNAEITNISKRLKNLYKRLNLVGITLCQLNRGEKDNENNIPKLTNLRESGSLEQDGDLIIMLHRRDYYRQMLGQRDAIDNKLEVYVEKNKAGPTGMVEMYFDGDHQDIYDWDMTVRAVSAAESMGSPSTAYEQNKLW